MIGLDCNILVQLAFAEHPANKKLKRSWKQKSRAAQTRNSHLPPAASGFAIRHKKDARVSAGV
jgi:hypothetical protein